MENVRDNRTGTVEDSNAKRNLPSGFQLKPEFATILGDVIEAWNFLCYFHKSLCLNRSISLGELTTQLTELFPSTLQEAHISMLRILLEDLLKELESTPKSHIKGSDVYVAFNTDLAILNELTWPELARRCALVLPSVMCEKLKLTHIHDISRYLYGDRGSSCGALTGLVGQQVDSQLFAEATNAIYGFLHHDEVLFIDDTQSQLGSGLVSSTILANDRIPDWVRELEPVKNLKTNVGSKIRACIKKSIEICPEEWAKVKLENSISKEVYRGNASGPTKTAALGVVAHFHAMQKKAALCQRSRKAMQISTIILRKCHILLRQIVNEFHKLHNEKHDTRLLHILTRPLNATSTDMGLDFRTIDKRLGAGTYCGSHQAFEEDVLELLNSLSPASSDLVKKFQQEFNKEVILFKKREIHGECITTK